MDKSLTQKYYLQELNEEYSIHVYTFKRCSMHASTMPNPFGLNLQFLITWTTKERQRRLTEGIAGRLSWK